MATYYVDPAATGDNNGTTWTHAWSSVQSAFDTADANDIVYCRGTQTVSAQIDVDTQTGGNATGFIKFIGCNASGERDGTRFVIQGDGSNACDLLYLSGGRNMYWLENIELKSAHTGKSAINSANITNSGWVFVNCSFNNCASHGINNGRYSISAAFFYRCTFYSNGGSGIYNTLYSYAPSLVCCSAHSNTGSGLGNSTNQSWTGNIVGSLIFDNGDDGVLIAILYGHNIIMGSVIDKNSDDGILLQSLTTAAAPALLGCRITNHSGSGDIGLNVNGEPLIAGWNYFENNDGDNIQNGAPSGVNLYQFLPTVTGADTNIQDQSNTNQGYTTVGSGTPRTDADFNLRSDASLRRSAITVPLS